MSLAMIDGGTPQDGFPGPPDWEQINREAQDRENQQLRDVGSAAVSSRPQTDRPTGRAVWGKSSGRPASERPSSDLIVYVADMPASESPLNADSSTDTVESRVSKPVRPDDTAGQIEQCSRRRTPSGQAAGEPPIDLTLQLYEGVNSDEPTLQEGSSMSTGNVLPAPASAISESSEEGRPEEQEPGQPQSENELSVGYTDGFEAPQEADDSTDPHTLTGTDINEPPPPPRETAAGGPEPPFGLPEFDEPTASERLEAPLILKSRVQGILEKYRELIHTSRDHLFLERCLPDGDVMCNLSSSGNLDVFFFARSSDGSSWMESVWYRYKILEGERPGIERQILPPLSSSYDGRFPNKIVDLANSYGFDDVSRKAVGVKEVEYVLDRCVEEAEPRRSSFKDLDEFARNRLSSSMTPDLDDSIEAGVKITAVVQDDLRRHGYDSASRIATMMKRPPVIDQETGYLLHIQTGEIRGEFGHKLPTVRITAVRDVTAGDIERADLALGPLSGVEKGRCILTYSVNEIGQLHVSRSESVFVSSPSGQEDILWRWPKEVEETAPADYLEAWAVSYFLRNPIWA